MEEKRKIVIKVVILLLITLFCIAMIEFYGEWGECAGNLVFAVCITFFLFYSWLLSRKLAGGVRGTYVPTYMALIRIIVIVLFWIFALARCT